MSLPANFQATASAWVEKAQTNLFYFISKYAPKEIPIEWVFGIVFNECSNMDTKAHRFESSVYESIKIVRAGKASTAFPGFNSGRIKDYISVTNDLEKLKSLATSYGPGQLMGYHYFMKFGLKPENYMNLTMEQGIKYLCDFMALEHQRVIYPVFHGKGPDGVIRDYPPYEQLLRIWNTGQKNGNTFDPLYVSNATTVATIYKEKYGGKHA